MADWEKMRALEEAAMKAKAEIQQYNGAEMQKARPSLEDAIVRLGAYIDDLNKSVSELGTVIGYEPPEPGIADPHTTAPDFVEVLINRVDGLGDELKRHICRLNERIEVVKKLR